MTVSTSTQDLRQSPELPQNAVSLVEGLAEDMVARWRIGERPVVEYYLDRFPQFQGDPRNALELIAEELTLREEFGEPISLQELDQRFPLWPAQIRALIQCQRTLGRQSALFPAAGEKIGDFQLLSELGRGARSRVFLAEQPSLGSRLVVLKLGPMVGHEHLSLARLQHSHIVPLYSMHEFSSHGLRGLCQPYFGGASLFAVLERLRQCGHHATGHDLFAALHRDSHEDLAIPCDLISGQSYRTLPLNDLICWIGACLADALQYAHDRGLLHLDIKPSNVLIAADGVPMLLDFHLAHPPLRAGEPAPHWIGGTPAYMPPEQQAALEAVSHATPLRQSLDARADVYALGMVLKECLKSVSLNDHAAGGSVGLCDILERSTAQNAADRYPTAAALAQDLRRHLAHLPLSGVANRSPVERFRKWRRRHPHGIAVVLLSATLCIGSLGWLAHSGRLSRAASQAYQDGMAQLNQGHYVEAIETLRGGEALVAGLPLHVSLRSQLFDSRILAERARAAQELHRICEQLRPYYAAEFATEQQFKLVERRCRELWAERESLMERLSGQPTPDLDRRWRTDLLDVAILLARLGEAGTTRASRLETHRASLATLHEAETLLGASGILFLEKARHLRILAQYTAAGEATAQAQAWPAETAWDQLVLGRYYLSVGDVRHALIEIDRSIIREPQLLWAHYYKGICCLKLSRPVEAVAEFSACLVIAPNVAWCIHNLGQAYFETGEMLLACNCFDRALALDPNLGASYLGRSMVHQRQARYADALADLRSAGDAGIAMAEVEYRKGLVYLAAADCSAALSCLRAALESDPKHVAARDTLNRINASR